jgi:hypothetical protein
MRGRHGDLWALRAFRGDHLRGLGLSLGNRWYIPSLCSGATLQLSLGVISGGARAIGDHQR